MDFLQCDFLVHIAQDDEAYGEKMAAPSSNSLNKTPRYPQLKPDLALVEIDDDDVPLSLYTTTDDVVGVENDDALALFSSVFERATSSSSLKKATSNKLWTDKYAMKQIPEDVLGAENKEAAKKLVDFIEEWKIRRHKSLQAKPKKSKSKRGRKKKGSCGYDSDDSFLDDKASGLESIFVISGKTGTGKTRLVHAVAEQCDCAIMEINSTEKRGGSDIKKRAQECTQSHSTIALSTQKKEKENNFFDAAKEVEIEDSDAGEKKDWYDTSDSEGEEPEESTSLTIILIDEGELPLYIIVTLCRRMLYVHTLIIIQSYHLCSRPSVRRRWRHWLLACPKPAEPEIKVSHCADCFIYATSTL